MAALFIKKNLLSSYISFNQCPRHNLHSFKMISAFQSWKTFSEPQWKSACNKSIFCPLLWILEAAVFVQSYFGVSGWHLPTTNHIEPHGVSWLQRTDETLFGSHKCKRYMCLSLFASFPVHAMFMCPCPNVVTTSPTQFDLPHRNLGPFDKSPAVMGR